MYSIFKHCAKDHQNRISPSTQNKMSDNADNKETKTVYFGETSCQATLGSGKRAGLRCNKKAYYKSDKRYLCGQHSAGNRVKLVKNPHAAKQKIEANADWEASIEEARKKNKERGIRGMVKCARKGMFTPAPKTTGFLNVFPNFKDQNRKDGFGCASLSPMSLGPVNHLQKNLPPARLLENYHQFNKVYIDELTRDRQPNDACRQQRVEGYKTKTPMRHKPSKSQKRTKDSQQGNKTRNKTAYSIHSDKNGVEKHYTYVQSRYFYCHFYEELSRGNKDLDTLHQKLKDGVNLQIVGFDGQSETDNLMVLYESERRPFGHELVLYTLLTVKEPKNYPWNVYYRKHKHLYPPELSPTCFAKDPVDENLVEIKEQKKEDKGKDDKKGKEAEKKVRDKEDKEKVKEEHDDDDDFEIPKKRKKTV